MNLPDNELGLNTLDDLIHWTNTYFHFKQALEVIGLAPELADSYFSAFEPFVKRLTQDLAKQERLEARLPKEMRESIAAEKPHLTVIREILQSRVKDSDPLGRAVSVSDVFGD